ncbi:MAG TPA: alcohol dehydrogenase catalytic domain-containing protein [Candidatus Marinimicrobia bacterium]|nr:alcohol dehydrogenase catalytic domain-containing protein [Candidatus Neomarinimicrobiota bacterium]HRS52054.1 alcohol dehydrogenase catalytic domain-containing protein [Candidatus Neomarinimicrobiota bacterium]HRU93084.1 alcohol dehydrogenase catalytic domain-containing protein [Candidatus Neomarinimicrobiota bacterium]
MKAVFLTGIKRFSLQQVADPTIVKDTDVLIRVKMVGVCGSDIHYYKNGRIGSQVIQFPFIVGHEAAGIVEGIGNKVTRVEIGQRIAIDPTVYCGSCDQCRSGRENTCRNLKFLGTPKQLSGALCEYIVLPENCCYPISERMTFEEAVLSEPLAIAIYSVERSHLQDNANVAILGVGPIGMSVFYVLRTKNVGNIYITDKIQERLGFAQQLNPRWSGNPDLTDIVSRINKQEPQQLDVVYECSGDMTAISQAVQLLKPGGTLVLVGIPEIDEISFPVHELRRKEITVINVRRQAHCTQKAIDLLENHLLNIKAMATHHFSLEETGEAFELVANYQDGVMKALISID